MDLNKSIVNNYLKRNSLKSSKEDPDKRKKIPDEPANGLLKDSSPKRKRRRQLDAPPSFDYVPVATFEHLYGFDEAKQELTEIVEDFKRCIDGVGQKLVWPTLICGSRGLGKTSIVEAVANYANLRLIRVPLRRLSRKKPNEFETMLKLLENHCSEVQPLIILFDDLDCLKGHEDISSALEEAIEGLSKGECRCLIFCTTSSIVDELSGLNYLFETRLKRPDASARLSILTMIKDKDKCLSNLNDNDLKSLAAKSPSFTAVDLMKMLSMARVKSCGTMNMTHCEAALEKVRSSFRRSTHLVGERPTVTWADIGGLPEVKEDFLMILEQIRQEDAACKFAGIALYGPPGCGKTMVAQAMANEAGFNFISIKPAELVDKYLGETEKNIRRVFSEAQEYEPCMIYFDEFDGLCGTRGNRDSVTSAIQTLLSEIDGFAQRGKSLILASTNRLEDIDPAMKRSGRLSKHIFVGPPDEAARRDILKVLTTKSDLPLSSCIDLNAWAKETQGFSGADLHHLISEAQSYVKIERRKTTLGPNMNLMDRHLKTAMDKIRAKREKVMK